MTQILRDLGNPSEFWDYFAKISKIPRCSGKETLIREYIKQEAEKFNFITKIDKKKNLFVEIPSDLKNNSNLKVVLQCHMDIVCEKNDNIKHDFLKDPLKLKIIEINNEKWLTAEGTTLGADNGASIAFLLTLMKKIHFKELDFGSLALELLFTVEEETGLNGASQIDTDLINGNYLINLDAENDKKIIIGCAGGINTDVNMKIIYEDLVNNIDNGLAIELSIKGLRGGHSGVEIHKKRVNALKILAKILWNLNNEFPIFINSINGGNMSNAIPREAKSIFFVNNENILEIKKKLDKIISKIKLHISNYEPNAEIEIKTHIDYNERIILPKKMSDKLLHILYVIPNGPITFHSKISDLVHTSTNLASIKTKNDAIEIITSQRSLNEVSKRKICEKIETLFRLEDFDINIQHSEGYPEWEPNYESKLLAKSKEIYKKLFNEEPIIEVIHAGLECAILKNLFPWMEMISIGPTMESAHCPEERISVKSIGKFWNFLIKLLENLK